MTATAIAAAAATVTTAATVVAATSTEAQDLLAPAFASGDFGVTAGALLISLPILLVLMIIAGSPDN
jgi:hypothetical protein